MCVEHAPQTPSLMCQLHALQGSAVNAESLHAPRRPARGLHLLAARRHARDGALAVLVEVEVVRPERGVEPVDELRDLWAQVLGRVLALLKCEEGVLQAEELAVPTEVDVRRTARGGGDLRRVAGEVEGGWDAGGGNGCGALRGARRRTDDANGDCAHTLA